MRALLALPRALWGMVSLLWAPRMGDLLIALAVLGTLALCGCEARQREWAYIAVLTLVVTAIIATPIGLWWLQREIIALRGQLDRIEEQQLHMAKAGDRQHATVRADLAALQSQTRGGWTWRMWRRLRGLPVVVLLALLGCEKPGPVQVPVTGMAACDAMPERAAEWAALYKQACYLGEIARALQARNACPPVAPAESPGPLRRTPLSDVGGGPDVGFPPPSPKVPR